MSTLRVNSSCLETVFYLDDVFHERIPLAVLRFPTAMRKAQARQKYLNRLVAKTEELSKRVEYVVLQGPLARHIHDNWMVNSDSGVQYITFHDWPHEIVYRFKHKND